MNDPRVLVILAEIEAINRSLERLDEAIDEDEEFNIDEMAEAKIYCVDDAENFVAVTDDSSPE